MFVRTRLYGRQTRAWDYSVQVVLVEAYRDPDSSKPRQRTIYLGSVSAVEIPTAGPGWVRLPDGIKTSCWELRKFWRGVRQRLDHKGIRKGRKTIEDKIAQKIPRLTAKQQRMVR